MPRARSQENSDTGVTVWAILVAMSRRTPTARLLLAAALVVGASVVALAPPAAAAPKAGDDLRVVNYNILHGIVLPDRRRDSCQAPDRVALFLDQLEARGCPRSSASRR